MKAVAVVAAVIVGLASGCDLLESEANPLVAGSQWRVARVDGETVGIELILTFIGDTATLSSECGAGTSRVAIDTDGRTVGFGPFDGPRGPAICSREAMDLHGRVAEALQGVERWEDAGSATELRGDSIVRIERQRTDT